MSDETSSGLPSPRDPVDRRTLIVTMAAVLAAAGCSSEGSPTTRRSVSGQKSPALEPTGSVAGSATGSAAGSAATSSAQPRATASTTHDAGPSPEPVIARSSGPDIVNGPRTRHEVALTFHGAGDRSLTEQILRDCADHHARISVFAVGQWLAGTPSLGPQILAAGHELGNHTWSHQQMPALSATEADDEIRRGAEALREATGSTGWWFRPSGTPHSTATIRAAAGRSGYRRCVSYDVDPRDYQDPGSSAVASRTLAMVRPGSIVSFHLGHAGTVKALPTVLAGLAAKGLAPVTLSRLLRD